jgi:hypothetical protein
MEAAAQMQAVDGNEALDRGEVHPAACPAISVAAPSRPVKVWRTACHAAVIAVRRATRPRP